MPVPSKVIVSGLAAVVDAGGRSWSALNVGMAGVAASVAMKSRRFMAPPLRRDYSSAPHDIVGLWYQYLPDDFGVRPPINWKRRGGFVGQL